MVQSISILGSTGSIGIQTLEVARHFNIKVVAISSNRNVDLIEKQAREFMPQIVSMSDIASAMELKNRLIDIKESVTVLHGMEGNIAVATIDESEMVVASMVGVAGLLPVISAIKAGKDIALANKETLVAGGGIVMPLAKKHNVSIYPVDSEHSAIWQCLNNFDTNNVNRIFLTASGGPFRGWKIDSLKDVTVSQALNHPTWKMGGKITIDSATMMNKGLEVIEAKWLFNIPLQSVEVVIHPQSIIHSMVEFSDGSVMGQMGFPDMKLPIQIALAKKQRVKGDYKPFNPFIANNLTFEKPDNESFKCLPLAYEAANIGGSMPGVMNSANEKAVELFLDGKIGFLDIANRIEKTMNLHMKSNFMTNIDLESIMELDSWARECEI